MSGHGSQRLSFELDSPRVRLDGAPRLTLEVGRAAATVEGEPLEGVGAHNRRARLRLEGLLGMLAELEVDASIGLRPGLYRLPSASWPLITVEVYPGTRLLVTCSCRPAGGELAAIDEVQLAIDPPLRWHNGVKAALSLAQRYGERWLPWEALGARLPRMVVDWLKRASQAADAAFSIDISRLQLRRVKDAGPGGLRLSVSGALRLGEAVIPLDDIPWAQPLAPHIDGELNGMIALLDAGLTRLYPRLTARWLLLRLRRLVTKVQGTFSVRVHPSPVTVSIAGADGTRTTAQLGIDAPLTWKGTVDIGPEQPSDQHEAPTMQPQPVSAARPSVQLDLAADLPSLVAAGAAPGDNEPTTTADAQPERLRLQVQLDQTLPPLQLQLRQAHPLCRGASQLTLALDTSELHAHIEADAADGKLKLGLSPPAILRAQVEPESSALLHRGDFELRSNLEGAVTITANQGTSGALETQVELSAEVQHQLKVAIPAITELDLHDGTLSGGARAALDVSLQLSAPPEGDDPALLRIEAARWHTRLHEAELHTSDRWLLAPDGSSFAGELRRAEGPSSAAGSVSADLRWDLHGRPCMLHARDTQGQRHAVSLLTPALRRGSLTLHLEPTGKLHISGPQDEIYGVRFFNALLNPAAEVQQWYRIFISDDAFRHVSAAIGVFSPLLEDQLITLRALALTAREIVRREGLRQLGDVIPRARITRVASLLLVGSDRLVDEIDPLVRHVTEGHGLPLAETRQLLERELGVSDLDYELHALLHWFNVVLRPSEPLSIDVPATRDAPLVERLELQAELSELPTAAQIYELARSATPSLPLVERVVELAPELSIEQLDYLVRSAFRERWGRRALMRLRRVLSVKRLIRRLCADYGGVEYAAQPFVIGSVLGEALGPVLGATTWTEAAGERHRAPCAIGPEEAAMLLRVGIAPTRQRQRAQLNNRLLLELMQQRDPLFTLAVLTELGQRSTHVLAGALYAFLEQDQDQLHAPLDLASLLNSKLGHDVPRQQDFLAGGSRARESYYESLALLAARIMTDGERYVARKQQLQQVRRVVLPELVIAPDLDTVASQAQQAVARADQLAGTCPGETRRHSARARCRSAYREAWAACAQLLRREPRAFQLPWMRELWRRTEEALRVLSVVRAHQNDLDQVRHWLAVRSGRDHFRGEQALVEATVRALYYQRADQQALLHDPLVRLLIDPEPGRYRFTIVSCMGVVTDGADGRELEPAYARLAERYGVEVLRAPTGTGRSLEYNAQMIIDTIRRSPTPYGLLGYSQGCANALLAEHLLYSGTPEQQALLDGLVSRNLLFSSANGSAHGTSAMSKLTQAMVLGERILKHYQATYSWPLIRATLRAFRAGLDAPRIVMTLSGMQSLSIERARELHRDGQFVPNVSTSTTRAVVTEDRLPEVLEYMFYVHRELTGGGEQDTQVLVRDAVGRATRVSNAQTNAFAGCEIDSFIQATHHWAPLGGEVDFITTERDRERAIYESPLDQLVWPWIEVNARFGRIERS